MQYKNYYQELKTFWELHLKELTESREVDITFIVNDIGDVLVRLKPVAVDKNDEEFADIMDQDQEEGVNE